MCIRDRAGIDYFRFAFTGEQQQQLKYGQGHVTSTKSWSIFSTCDFLNIAHTKYQSKTTETLNEVISSRLMRHNKTCTYFALPFLSQCFKVVSTGVEQINKLLNNTKIVPYFKTFKTQHIFKNKDTIPLNVSSSVVYEFSCEHCDKCYIGETRRHLYKHASQSISKANLHQK